MPIGSTGFGNRVSRSRLLLAQRAGYLPSDQLFPADPTGASSMYQRFSKNLGAMANRRGFTRGVDMLRAGAGQPMQGGSPILNYNSRVAGLRTPAIQRLIS